MNAEHAEQLLLEEARALDAGAFEDWLALYTPDAEYWVPVRAGHTQPDDGLSIIHDTRAMMEARVFRLRHAMVHAQQPASRACRLVGNIRCEAGAEWMTVRSILMMTEYRLDRQFVYAAHVEHWLVDDGALLQIRRKRIDLVNSEASHEMISLPF